MRIYGFEVGGNGIYDTQAGLEYSRDARAISTALGYNQLLNINSVNLMSEQGDLFIKTLRAKAADLSGAAKESLEKKIAVLERMVAFCRTVPNRWSEQEKLAQHAERSRRSRDEPGYRRRSAAADAQAARLDRVRAPEGISRAG